MKALSVRHEPLWVDFHCHLDLYPDHRQLIAECDRERVAAVTMTTTPKAWQRNQALAAQSKLVRVALGLHPQLIAERMDELALFERLLPEARYVGEIGLDAGPRFYRTMDVQDRGFKRMLCACAEHGGKILSIHSVRAVVKVLNHVERYLPIDRGRVVLHWFTGSVAEAKRATELGCYFSINGEMLRTARHRRLLTSLPRDRLLTETDGPFVERGGLATRPRDVSTTVAELAEVLGVSSHDMAQTILANRALLVGSGPGNCSSEVDGEGNAR